MNRIVVLGVAIFFALVGIALVGGESKALAFGHRGCCSDSCCGGKDSCCGGRHHRNRCCASSCHGRSRCHRSRCCSNDGCCGGVVYAGDVKGAPVQAPVQAPIAK